MDLAPLLLAVLAVAVAAGAWWWHRERGRRIEEAITALLDRQPAWERTGTLCGRTADQLADRTAATPRGDRRFGLDHLITGPLTVPVGGRDQSVPATCGHWWSEVRQTTTDGKGNTSTTYQRQVLPIVGVELPGRVPHDVSIVPSSPFGRVGLTRAGQQLESEAFNRRFRVDGADPALTLQLLDAGLQQHLLEHYPERRLGLVSDLLVLGGRPRQRDADLYGSAGDLAGLQRDAADLLAHIPAQFWRAIGVDTSRD